MESPFPCSVSQSRSATQSFWSERKEILLLRSTPYGAVKVPPKEFPPLPLSFGIGPGNLRDHLPLLLAWSTKTLWGKYNNSGYSFQITHEFNKSYLPIFDSGRSYYFFYFSILVIFPTVFFYNEMLRPKPSPTYLEDKFHILSWFGEDSQIRCDWG